MIWRCLFFMLAAICVQGCGGGAVSPTTDDSRLYFQSDTLVVDGAGVQVVGPLGLVDLGHPDWQGNSASQSDPALSYIMERQADFFVVAGLENGIGFHGVAGPLSGGYGNQPILYEATIHIIAGKTTLQHPVILTVNTHWDVPRVLGGVPELGIDIFADLDISGEFSGRVGFRQTSAVLQGGLFAQDPDLHAEYIAGAFSGDQFYGVLTGAKTDQP